MTFVLLFIEQVNSALGPLSKCLVRTICCPRVWTRLSQLWFGGPCSCLLFVSPLPGWLWMALRGLSRLEEKWLKWTTNSILFWHAHTQGMRQIVETFVWFDTAKILNSESRYPDAACFTSLKPRPSVRAFILQCFLKHCDSTKPLTQSANQRIDFKFNMNTIRTRIRHRN